MSVTWPIPAAYRDILLNTAQNKGIPPSWLAACCEQTGWNATFFQLNPTLTIRRLGIAGIWADIPELQFHCTGCGFWNGQIDAGWAPHLGTFQPALNAACVRSLDSAYELDQAKTVAVNLAVAADILNNCVTVLQGLCGGLSSLLWLRWQWGCHWIPEPQPGGGCGVPTGTSQAYIDTMNKMASDENEYALLLNAPPALAVGLQASPSQASVLTDITFTASASGGVPGYSYHFDFGDGQTHDTTSPTVVYQYSNTGVKIAFVRVTDSSGATAVSASIPVSITFSTLRATLSAAPTSAAPNASIAFTASASGGRAPYAYRFNFGDDVTAQGSLPTAIHAYPLEGAYNATVTVTDSLGDTVVAGPVAITIAVGGPGPGGGGSGVLWGLLGLVGLVGVLGLASKGGDKRARAQKLRREAAELRARAGLLRGQGKTEEAQNLERVAADKDAEAGRLEQEAAQEEAIKYRRQSEGR